MTSPNPSQASSMAVSSTEGGMDWLSGGGEMGRLIRSMDWSKTPLGPVETWPQSLRTTVSLCLSSTFPILIAWGPERVQIYNDSYRPICGAKHPESMGQPFRDCWATALPVVGGVFEKAGTGIGSYIENQRMFLDRYGYLEEAFMTFSFSPIRDESGGVGGLFHPITEVTEKMLSARRTQTLRELSALLGKVKTLEDIGAALSQLQPDAALDVPFLLFYRRDEAAPRVQWVGGMGLPPGTAWSPAEAGLDAPWPFTTAGVESVDVPRAPLDAGLTLGPYEEPPVHARVLPIHPAGMAEPFGYLVAGVSPRRAMDDAYRNFYEQFQATVTNAVASVRAYEAEAQRAEALAAIDRAKTTFFSNVSHEFRTPLTLILGPLEESLADASAPLPPTQRARQELTHRNALRLLKLVNSLLDFSRIEAGRVKARFHPTDLAKLTEDLASVFRSAMEKAGLQYSVDARDVGEPVYVDRDMWEKVVLNLLSNAFKFTLHGGVTVRLQREGARARLTVRDTGTGIPEAELPRVFERFHRVESSHGRTHEGTGIGLALIQELVKLHGGTLSVQSVEGEGSTFSVELPLGRAHLAAEQVQEDAGTPHAGKLGSAFSEEALRWLPDAPESPPPGSEPEPEPMQASVETTVLGNTGAGFALSTRRGSVLVADDNADMRAYVSSLLSAHWSVRAVADGEAAFEAALEAKPDLIVSDVMMPRLDGFGLLQKLRGDARTRGIPFIMLSARAGEEARIEGLQAGADDYLVKPFSARELIARVDSQLQLGRARRQLSDFFMQAPAAMCVMSGPDLVFTVINPLFAALMGRDMLGRPARDAQPEGGHGVLIQHLERVYRTGEPFVGREVPVRQPDGQGGLKELLLDVDIHAQRDGEGRIQGLLVAVQEVSERTHARQQLEALTHDLQHALASRDSFLGVASHELKTPVTALLLHLEMTRRRLSPKRGEPPSLEKIASAMESAQRQVERMSRLVDELLDVSRIRAGKLDLHMEESDPMELVHEVLDIFREQLDQAQCVLQLRAELDLRVWWDRSRMQQVLTNLVSNAIKYAPGTALGIGLRKHDDRLILYVSDGGPGIPPEHQDRVFERFERGGPPRSVHGLGLGLFIAQQIVQGHGGKLVLKSTPGQGAAFIIDLPLPPRAQA
ncbi:MULTISPECIES: ATP-binding response regulator [unclassified Corallococcus]|uniref:ATP-binding response regulator n=1 Tax=unclassified Corallococcus TaxID=2685029 RepID=UPI001A906214|nr:MULTISPECIES: ATP-binding protein [unclassified Corallococcus]MBN9681817.1 response regulator [Corallococcus sp. NCSPR001]WAS86613.1 ATP-binding protein [Corallococcus sp. NCRR]